MGMGAYKEDISVSLAKVKSFEEEGKRFPVITKLINNMV